MEIKYLEWDSNFFNLKVGSIYVENEMEFFNVNFNEYDLVYIFSQNENLNFNFVDKKITYIIEDLKKIEPSDTLNIQYYCDSDTGYKELLNLALQSGEYSRFKRDSNFKKNEYGRLYTEWINNSINKRLASHIIVKKLNNKIIGFTTLSKKNELLADIGLVAVDENFRGQGIASELMSQAISLAKSIGVEKIQVVTQEANIPANILYKKCGFDVDSIINIYHYWNHDTI